MAEEDRLRAGVDWDEERACADDAATDCPCGRKMTCQGFSKARAKATATKSRVFSRGAQARSDGIGWKSLPCAARIAGHGATG
jgi:hypothetical protein